MVSVPATKIYPACNLMFVGEMERWRKRKKSEMEREKERVIDRVAPGGSIYSM